MPTIVNKNQWTALGVVAQEPHLKKLGDKKVFAFTVLITESAGENVYLPLYAFNKKAQVFAQLAHKGSVIFVKGIFRTAVKTTSVQGKQLIQVFLKVNDFEVMIREPVKVDEIDFADTVALYDPDNYMEEEEDGKPKDSQETRPSEIEK